MSPCRPGTPWLLCAVAQGSGIPPDQNAALAENRVFPRQRQARDALHRGIVLGRIATADVVIASVGISTDDKEILGRGLAFVPGAGGQDRHVARSASTSPASPPKQTCACPCAMPSTSCVLL